MRKNKNKSYYHYCVEEFDNNENLINKKYFMTLNELEETYKKSRFTFNRILNNPNIKIKSLPNLSFKRVRIPVYNTVLNNLEIE